MCSLSWTASPNMWWRDADSLLQVQRAKKISQLDRGCLRGIRAVDAIPLDAAGEPFPHRAFGGVGGIGRAHYFAQLLDRVLPLESQRDDPALRHEFHQAG